MDEARKQTRSKDNRLFLRMRSNLARMPVLDVVAQGVLKEAGKLFNKKTVQDELQKLASRKRRLEDVLLGFARGASRSLDAVMREEQRVAEQEKRMNEKYWDSLIARCAETKPRTTRQAQEKEYLVSGKVLHPNTGEPVPGMVVEAMDKDIAKHDLLGVDTTDSEGRFEISFRAKDVKDIREELRKVVLRVGIDRKSTVRSESAVITLKPGEAKTADIILSKSQMGVVDRVMAARDRVDRRRLRDVSQTLTFQNVEHAILREMGQAFTESLENAIRFLEARTGQADKKKRKPPQRSKEKQKQKKPIDDRSSKGKE